MRALALALATVAAAGCAHARGLGPRLDPADLDAPGWTAVRGVPYVHQRDLDSCGAAAAAMVLGYWQRPAPDDPPIPKGGLRALDVRELLRGAGLRAFVIEGTDADLDHEIGAGRPVIVGVRSHYVVVVALDDTRVAVVDPAVGLEALPRDWFEREWAAAAHTTVIGLPPRVSAATTPPSSTDSEPR